MPSTDRPAVEVRGLHVVRGGRPVLHGLDLDIAAGRLTGLIGPSGSGKTTLMRCVVGVQRIRSGRVDVLGLPAGDPRLRHSVAYLTQTPSVYGDLSALANLRFFASLLNAPDGDVDRVVDAVGLGSRATVRVDRLSGGERSRVGLATTLLGSPQVLVLDEPTVGLDPVLRAELWSLFARLASAGAAVIVSSHVMDEASRCERVLLLHEGRVLADGSPAQLLAMSDEADLDAAFLHLVRGRAG